MVYFPNTRESLYQLRQWYGPITALHEKYPVIVIFQDSRTAKIARAESGLRCVTISRYGVIDGLLSRSNVKLALYVNHSPQNFVNLRFLSVAHIYLGHAGESVEVSNQLKAYDFCFVAGQADVDQLGRYALLDEVKQRAIAIGRPQLDFGPPPSPDDRPRGFRLPTVLYAPIGNRAQPSMSFSSVASHGETIVGALLASRRYRVIYRPDPLSGVTDQTIGQPDCRIRAVLRAAAVADPTAGHRVDVDCDFAASAAASDILICDPSGVAVDYLPSGKPLIITEPSNAGVVPAGTPLLRSVARLSVDDAAAMVEIVAEQLELDPLRQKRLELVEYYVGDTTPGAATRRFIEACEHVMHVRDHAWAEVLARGRAGP